jgi:hypothetical protein
MPIKVIESTVRLIIHVLFLSSSRFVSVRFICLSFCFCTHYIYLSVADTRALFSVQKYESDLDQLEGIIIAQLSRLKVV